MHEEIIRDIREDSSRYTGIVMECQACEDILPIRVYIRDKQCPHCYTGLKLTVETSVPLGSGDSGITF